MTLVHVPKVYTRPFPSKKWPGYKARIHCIDVHVKPWLPPALSANLTIHALVLEIGFGLGTLHM